MTNYTTELHALRNLLAAVESLLDSGATISEDVQQAVSVCRALGKRSYEARRAADANGGRGGCVDFDLPLPGTPTTRQISKSKSKQAKDADLSAAESPKRGTWVSPFARAWRERFQAEPPWGRLAAALRNLCKEHGEAEVLRRWQIYLGDAEPQYVNPQRFAFTYGAWDGSDTKAPNGYGIANGKPIPSPRPGESSDDYAMRLARAGF